MKNVSLAKENLSQDFHILKLMTHSIYSIPHDGISADDVIEKTKQWLGISPFKKASLVGSLKSMHSKSLIACEKDGKTLTYQITDKGVAAYNSYVDVMTLWKLEKTFGNSFQLHTVSEVYKKSAKFPSTHIPETAFYDWPLAFKSVKHHFEDNKEIRVFEAFEKKTASGA